MERLTPVLIPLVLLPWLLRLLSAPVKWFGKLLARSFCGLLCLLLVNSISGITGLQLPVNPATVLLAGALGLPGIVLLILVQIFL